MASNVTVIGRTTRVRGRVTGDGDVEVQGFVEGEISVGGDVTVDAHGIVGAGVRGRRLLVRGAVKGDLLGEESILLEQGARVVGDLRAPRVAIAPGAMVRGYVQTGDADAGGARAHGAPAAAAPSRPQHAAAAAPGGRRARRPRRSGAVAAPVKLAAPPPPAPAKVAPKPVPVASASATRRPPPPVVPALRSSKGQIAKKKER